MSQALWQCETNLSPGPSSAQQAQEFVGLELWQHHREDLVADVQSVAGDLVAELLGHASGSIVIGLEEHPFCMILTVCATACLPTVLPTHAAGDLDVRVVPTGVGSTVDWGADTDAQGRRSVWVMFALRPPTFSEWLAGG